MKTILIATEGHKNDNVLQTAIQQRDYHFIVVRSLDEALDVLQEHSRIDIAIIQEDFDMPDTAWVVARVLRHRFGFDTRIVIWIDGRNEDYDLVRRWMGLFDWVLMNNRSAMVAHLLHEFDYSSTAA